MEAAAAIACIEAGLMLYLGKKPPISICGKSWIWFVIAVIAVNIWCMATLWDHAILTICTRTFLTNILLGMSITDLREKMVYNIHFYLALLAGIMDAIAAIVGLAGRVALFLILLGCLYLISRKKDGLGMGDSRMIACLALYFSFNRWMEVMLLSLGSAAVYGMIGLVRRKKTMATELPFMPFLLVGVLVEFML